MSRLSSTEDLDKWFSEMPESALERIYIEEYLKSKGHSPESLRELPIMPAKQLMIEACRYATFKLTEVEARARFKREIHGITLPP